MNQYSGVVSRMPFWIVYPAVGGVNHIALVAKYDGKLVVLLGGSVEDTRSQLTDLAKDINRAVKVGNERIEAATTKATIEEINRLLTTR